MSKTQKRFSKTKLLYRAYKYRYRDDVDELKYITSSISNGDFALDVGAHKGGYLHWIRKAVGDKGSVIAFEPQPSLFAYLTEMKASYRYQNLTLHHAGLSAEEGELELYIPKAEGLTSPGATFEKRADSSKGHFVKVPVFKLDKLLAEHPKKVNFIKMDVEGHELEVFKGANEILTTDRPKLIFECENRHLNGISVEDVFEHLKSIDYVGHFFQNGKLLPIGDFKADVHQQIDAQNEIVDKKSYANNFVFEPK